jgi:hypothetical protein
VGRRRLGTGAGNALEERQPVRLRWDFELQDGQRFTDERYAVLLETSRQLIALIRARSLFTGLPLRPSTVAQYFFTLRCLLQWMDGEGFSRFRCSTRRRCCSSSSGCARVPWPATPSPRAPGTVLRHLYLFAYFHRFRGELDDSLSFDPFAGHDQRRAAGYHEGLRRPWPYTPDTVAVKLVQAAIDIVTRDAPVVLRAWRRIGRRWLAVAAPAMRTPGGRHVRFSVPAPASPMRTPRCDRSANSSGAPTCSTPRASSSSPTWSARASARSCIEGRLRAASLRRRRQASP